MNLKEKIRVEVDDINNEIVKIRQHLHQHPELSFEEKETAQFVKSRLDEWGISYTDGWAGYGIVAIIDGDLNDGRTVALRGDMDALPIMEENEVSYKSVNQGIMHACGHDVHTSCLLGAMKVINKLKPHFGGKVIGVFQPGEEKLPGGASMMLKEGIFESSMPDAMFALHVHPPLEVGKVGLKPNMYMASADEIYLSVEGKGGHAALPENFIDSVLMASKIIVALQEVVARHAPPTVPSVLSFGKINSDGGATNVIPERVNIEGTFRTMNEQWRDEAFEIITRIAEKTAESMGGKCIVDIKKGYPYLHNDASLTRWAKIGMQEILSENQVIDLPLRMTAEDFAYFSQTTKSCFFRLGTGNAAKGITSPVHTSTFDIDENAIRVGVETMSYLAVKYLMKGDD